MSGRERFDEMMRREHERKQRQMKPIYDLMHKNNVRLARAIQQANGDTK